MKTPAQTKLKDKLEKGVKAIWNYSRIHYASSKAISRDGMEVIVGEIYNNGHAVIYFGNGISTAMLSELTIIK